MVKRILKALIDSVLVMLILTFVWQQLEIYFEGCVQPRTVDDIMMLIFGAIIFHVQLNKH